MRYIKKDRRVKPKSLRGTQFKTHWNQIVSSGNKTLIKAAVYADHYGKGHTKGSRVIDVLDKWYLRKCAYCERVHKRDVEHYRPAKAVKNLDNKKIHGHRGYYWLCYEWTNLIPACPNCNREGAKHNKFPVINSHKLSPPLSKKGTSSHRLFSCDSTYLLAEQPYLLHPEIDQPQNFFSFEIDDKNEGIKMVGIDAAKRGETTIEICLLNRMELKTARQQEVIDDFVIAVHASFTKYLKGEQSKTAFKKQVVMLVQAMKDKSKKPEFSFTLFRKFLLKQTNFEAVIIPFLKKKCRLIVIEAFKEANA